MTPRKQCLDAHDVRPMAARYFCRASQEDRSLSVWQKWSRRPDRLAVRRGTRRAALVLALASLFLACSVDVSSHLFWENGQLCVLGEELSSPGVREGAWCYFDQAGGVLLKTRVADGPTLETGYYVAGEKVRDLTEGELRRACVRAAELTSEYRERAARNR